MVDEQSRLEYLLGRGNYSEIARLTGLSRTHVSRVLRGKVGASLTVATEIAAATGVTLDELNAFIEKKKKRSV